MQFLRRRRRWRTAVTVLTLLIALALILADRGGWLLVPGDDLAKYDGRTFAVMRVIDGDTFDIAVPDGEHLTTRVRLWGIDTPEMAREDLHRPADPFATEAAAFVEALLAGRIVTLRLEPHRTRGNFGRLLAFVELSDGQVLNERLLLAGLARADDRWPHHHVERYALLELQAQRERRGIWANPKAPAAQK